MKKICIPRPCTAFLTKNLFLTLLFTASTLFAQQSVPDASPTLPEVIPPSPEVSNLMQFEEVPVSFYTGEPNIALPIVSKKADENIVFSLAARYATSGVKIDTRSSWTGTGWSLDGVGVISRTVVGIADDLNEADKVGVLYNEYYKYPNINQVDIGEFKWNAVNGNPSFDTETDLFQFNVLGRSGRFIIVRNDNNEIEARLFNLDMNYKIEPFFNAQGTITSFNIIDDMGYTFSFEESGVESTFQSTSSYSTTSGSSGITSQYAYNSAWKLTKITSPLNVELATISYANVSEVFRTEGAETFATVIAPTGINFNSPDVIAAGLRGTTRSHTLHTVGTKKISEINFHDNSRIVFERYTGGHPEYFLVNNTDLTGTQLKSVKLYNTSNTLVDQSSFSYQTTTNNRLFLTEIKKGINSANLLSYTMTYNDEQSLPEYNSDKQDSWGYYRATAPTDNTDTTVGLLTAITYPQGGKKEFVFEQHAVSQVGDQAIDPMDIPENFIDFNFTQSFSATNNQASSTVGIIHANVPTAIDVTPSNLNLSGNDNLFYVLKLTSVIPNGSVNENCPSCNSTSSFSIDSNGEVRILPLEQVTNNYYINSGWYFVTIEPDPSTAVIPSSSNGVDVDISIDYQKYNSSNPILETRGSGFRIQEIKFTENNEIKDHTFYNYQNFNDPSISSGSYDGDLYDSRSYEVIENIVFVNTGANGILNPSLPVTYRIKEVSPNHFSQMTKGSYVGYQNITVSKQDNGKTQYTYTYPGDYPSKPQNYGYPFVPLPDVDYKRGLLTKTEVFDNDNNRVTVAENEYEFKEAIIGESMLFKKNLEQYNPANCAVDILFSSYGQYINTTGGLCVFSTSATTDNIGCNHTVYPCGIPYTEAGGIPYDHLATMAQLKETVSRNYFGSNYTETTQKTFYDSAHNYPTRQETTINSDDRKIITKTLYVQDVPTSELYVNILTATNRIAHPLQVETYRTDANGTNEQLLQLQKTEYGNFNGLILPQFIKTLKSNQGITTPETRIVFHDYDSFGNPTEVSQKDGTHISYLWSYYGQYPVAKIENATYAQVATALGTGGLGINLTSDLTATQENDLRTALPEAQVTTYTYKPLVGMTSVTDPRGYTMTYHYDDLNRLQYVKDQDGNILSENKYNYKN